MHIDAQRLVKFLHDCADADSSAVIASWFVAAANWIVESERQRSRDASKLNHASALTVELRKELQGWIARSAEQSSRLDVVSKEVEGMEALLEKEHNDLLAWKHRATSAEDRLEAVLKLAREGTPDAESRGDEDGHYAQGQIDLGKAIKAILVEKQEKNS